MASVSETTCETTASFDATSTALSVTNVARNACANVAATIASYIDNSFVLYDASNTLNAAYASAVIQDATVRNAIGDAADAVRDANIAIVALDVAYDRIKKAMKLL